MIVAYLFSLNPLINPRGACFFEYPTSGSRALKLLKNRTAWESGGVVAGVEWGLKKILRSNLLTHVSTFNIA